MGGAESPTLAEFFGAWSLFRDPVLTAVAAGAMLGWLGTWVVLRRAVFVTAAFSQSAALGVVLAFFLEIYSPFAPPPLVVALLLSGVCGVAVAGRVERLRAARDQVLAVLYLGAAAMALLLGDHIAQEAQDVQSVLYGTAVLVRPEDVRAVVVVGAAVALVQAMAFRPLLFVAVDADAARVRGLPVPLLESLAWGSLALAVAVTTRALGALPVFAMAVLPGIAALLLFDRLLLVFAAALFLGAVGGGLGYVVAFFASTPVGATQASILSVVAALVFALRAIRGRA